MPRLQLMANVRSLSDLNKGGGGGGGHDDDDDGPDPPGMPRMNEGEWTTVWPVVLMVAALGSAAAEFSAPRQYGRRRGRAAVSYLVLLRVFFRIISFMLLALEAQCICSREAPRLHDAPRTKANRLNNVPSRQATTMTAPSSPKLKTQKTR